MSTSRRSFIKASAAAGGALGLGAFPVVGWARQPADALSSPSVAQTARPLSILILGGTGFTGPEQVKYALARGHSVTLINRNKTRPDFFKGRVEQLVGDFNGDLSALKGRKFDVVLDNPTILPAWIRNTAQYLQGNVGHYVFISTFSVYSDNSRPGADESDSLTAMPAGLDPYGVPPADARKYYGALKAFSERQIAKLYPDRYTIVRPGLIVGPLDTTDRFTYWPYRIDKGGSVLAPGNPTDPVQFIDARDLGEWMVRMGENKTNGIFNATGPDKPLTIAEMLYGIKAITTAGAQFVWVPADFLAEQRIRGWRDMTVWMNPVGPTAGMARRDVSKAVAAGLTFRPLALTARDTLDWNRTRSAPDLSALAKGAVGGISAEREAQVLAAWRAKQSARGARS